jgi:hypothetical protein
VIEVPLKVRKNKAPKSIPPNEPVPASLVDLIAKLRRIEGKAGLYPSARTLRMVQALKRQVKALMQQRERLRRSGKK